MLVLAKKNTLLIDGFGLKICESCLIDKQIWVSLQIFSSKRKTGVLDLVHSDVCFMSDKIFDGYSYFVIFIDDHSQKVWTYILKIKYQALDIFKQFHIFVKREIR